MILILGTRQSRGMDIKDSDGNKNDKGMPEDKEEVAGPMEDLSVYDLPCISHTSPANRCTRYIPILPTFQAQTKLHNADSMHMEDNSTRF